MLPLPAGRPGSPTPPPETSPLAPLPSLPSPPRAGRRAPAVPGGRRGLCARGLVPLLAPPGGRRLEPWLRRTGLVPGPRGGAEAADGVQVLHLLQGDREPGAGQPGLHEHGDVPGDAGERVRGAGRSGRGREGRRGPGEAVRGAEGEVRVRHAADHPEGLPGQPLRHVQHLQ